MKTDDYPRFGRLMSLLAATYRTDVTPILVDAYWEALNDLPIEDVEDAAKESIRESKFFPKPAELREIADPPRGYQPGDGLLTPMPDFRPIEQRERLEGPVSLEKCLPAGEGIVAWRFNTKGHEPAAPMQKPEDVEARKAALREQARILKERGL